jgi:hypothetical protein
VKSKAFIFVVSLLLMLVSGCSKGMSESTKLGIYVCSQVGVIDQFLQEKNTEVNYSDMLATLYKHSDDAVAYDLDRYMQLDLMVDRLKEAVERNDPKVILFLVAVEGECKNLGFI